MWLLWRRSDKWSIVQRDFVSNDLLWPQFWFRSSCSSSPWAQRASTAASLPLFPILYLWNVKVWRQSRGVKRIFIHTCFSVGAVQGPERKRWNHACSSFWLLVWSCVVVQPLSCFWICLNIFPQWGKALEQAWNPGGLLNNHCPSLWRLQSRSNLCCFLVSCLQVKPLGRLHVSVEVLHLFCPWSLGDLTTWSAIVLPVNLYCCSRWWEAQDEDSGSLICQQRTY